MVGKGGLSNRRKIRARQISARYCTVNATQTTSQRFRNHFSMTDWSRVSASQIGQSVDILMVACCERVQSVPSSYECSVRTSTPYSEVEVLYGPQMLSSPNRTVAIPHVVSEKQESTPFCIDAAPVPRSAPMANTECLWSNMDAADRST